MMELYLKKPKIMKNLSTPKKSSDFEPGDLETNFAHLSESSKRQKVRNPFPSELESLKNVYSDTCFFKWFSLSVSDSIHERGSPSDNSFKLMRPVVLAMLVLLKSSEQDYHRRPNEEISEWYKRLDSASKEGHRLLQDFLTEPSSKKKHSCVVTTAAKLLKFTIYKNRLSELKNGSNNIESFFK